MLLKSDAWAVFVIKKHTARAADRYKTAEVKHRLCNKISDRYSNDAAITSDQGTTQPSAISDKSSEQIIMQIYAK